MQATKTLSIGMILGITLLVSGCTSKDSILVPGQSESDCADKTAGLGVCGTPLATYKHREKIKRIYHEEGESYRVTKGGKIYNTETGEEVIPGVKPSGACGTEAICVGCDEANDAAYSESNSGGTGAPLGGHKHPAQLKNRTLAIETPQSATFLRDLGMQQTIWIAPAETAGDDLVEAHRIHVVVREPSWVIGEEFPQRTNRGVIVPTPIAAEVISDNHEAVDKKTLNNIYQYVQDRKTKTKANEQEKQ